MFKYMSGPSLVIIQLFPLFFTIYVTSFGTKAIANFNSIQLARKSWTRQMSLKSSQRKKKRASRTRLIQEHSKNFKMKTSRRKSVDWSHWLSELLKVYHLQSNLKQKCRHCGHPFKFQIHRQYYVLLQFCSLKLTSPKKRLPNLWFPNDLVYCYSRSSCLHSQLVINKRAPAKVREFCEQLWSMYACYK